MRFYEDVLGILERSAPAVQFPGAWLYSAGHPCCTSTTSPRRQGAARRFRRHRSCRVRQPRLRGDEAASRGKGVPHRVNQVPNSTRWQIFLRDPNNVEIELNFETKNETAAEFAACQCSEPRRSAARARREWARLVSCPGASARKHRRDQTVELALRFTAGLVRCASFGLRTSNAFFAVHQQEHDATQDKKRGTAHQPVNEARSQLGR